ncbi:hypothetical protein P3L10_008878 [Capsicum annuum]|uniref:uncharacterized protein LOC107862614 n=1 Tax=Capsicum annuum TaxID=4072 RepID=UPI001FB0924B|nr:uncharacterized protein LOC107862614 [Capsicum annuum]
MASENNVRPQSANAAIDKSKGKNKVSKTRGCASSPIAGTQSRRFSPSTQSRNVMSDSIKSSYPDAWSIWREIPVFVRDQMWNHFRKECVWDPKHDYQIFCNFEKQAADTLYDMLWTSWKNDQKPYFMPEGIWARLDEK